MLNLVGHKCAFRLGVSQFMESDLLQPNVAILISSLVKFFYGSHTLPVSTVLCKSLEPHLIS